MNHTTVDGVTRSIVGSKCRVDGKPFVVVGVSVDSKTFYLVAESVYLGSNGLWKQKDVIQELMENCTLV